MTVTAIRPTATAVGPVIIRTARQHHGHYLVTCEYRSTGALIDELTRTWPTAGQAAAMHRRGVAYFELGGSVVELLDQLTAKTAA